MFMTHAPWQDQSRTVGPLWNYNEAAYGAPTDPGRPHVQYSMYEHVPTALPAHYGNQHYYAMSQDFQPWRASTRPPSYPNHYSSHDHGAAHSFSTYQPMSLQQHWVTANALNGGYLHQAHNFSTPNAPQAFSTGSFQATGHVAQHISPMQHNSFPKIHRPSYPYNHTARSAPFPAMHPQYSAHTPSLPLQARGPPRKPKRSGYAIWVGNIPMGASIEQLKDHFSHDATREIESVFLMSKSNCAFVNYKTQAACHAAVERFNHSLFGCVRLLCRLRRDTTSFNDAPRSPVDSKIGSSRTTSAGSDAEQDRCQLEEVADKLMGLGINQAEGDVSANTTNVANGTHAISSVPVEKSIGDRYFIVKSLTKEDLQESLQKGTWETQLHNQRTLDQAYLSAADVYLIFSVNKSGEYFGYARMISSPLDDSARQPAEPSPPVAIGGTPDPSPYGIKVTRTPATATAPKGYIVADAVRGTLFWEAETSALNSGVGPDDHSPDIVSSTPSTAAAETSQERVQSRPFKVEWLSVRRIPFQRVKGLRNPWNANKEVKIARDGTELETELGRRVVGMFYEFAEEEGRGS